MSFPKHSLAERIAKYIVNVYINRGIFEHQEEYDMFVKVLNHLKNILIDAKKTKNVLLSRTYLMNKADKFCSQLALLKYQFVADYHIYRYIKGGSFPRSEKESIWNYMYDLAVHREVVQRYEGRNQASFKTYFEKCVTTFLNEKYRNDKRKYRLHPNVNDDNSEEENVYQNETTYAPSANQGIMDNLENIPAPASPTSPSYLRAEMIESIEALILLDGSLKIEKRKKLRLCLMIEMRLTLQKRDILMLWKDCSKAHLKMMLDNFGKDYHHLSNNEILFHLTQFMNAYQQQDNDVDAIRMWLDRRKKVLLSLKKLY